MVEVHVDVEMTGLTMKNDTISFAMIANKDNITHILYCEISNFDRDTIEEDGKEFINNHVIGNLLMNSVDSITILKDIEDDKGNKVSITAVKDIKESVVKHTTKWLDKFNDDVLFIADCCAYDTCHIFELWGGAFKIPKYICPVMYDINQDISRVKNVSLYEAFDMSREGLSKNMDNDIIQKAVFAI